MDQLYIPDWAILNTDVEADISDTLEILPRDDRYRPGRGTQASVFIKIAYYEDMANARAAVTAAIRSFRKVVGDTENVYKASVTSKKNIVLFTSRQIEYTIEVVTDEGAVNKYYTLSKP
jgi:hypothetical protein